MDHLTTTSPTAGTQKSGKKYFVNEVFYSIQGEGVRAGTANVFVRFSGCNLTCNGEWVGGQDGVFQPVCDTEFASGRRLSLDELAAWIQETKGESDPVWLILTGGEPGLQVDEDFCAHFHRLGYQLAMETNGTIDIVGKLTPESIDWLTVSPKVAEHAVRVPRADEIKYVRAYGQGIPKPICIADHYLISPAFGGDGMDKKTLDWCIKLCLENPKWRLSVQQHKQWRVR